MHIKEPNNAHERIFEQSKKALYSMNEKIETRFVEICSILDPYTGEITLYINNETWGPIITSKTLDDAKRKFEEAFGLCMIMNSLCTVEAIKNNEDISSSIINNNLEFIKAKKSLNLIS